VTIGIDIRVLARGTRTGVEEYTINLLSHLLPLESKIDYRLFYNAYRKVKLNYPWLFLNNVELQDFKIPNRFFFVGARYFGQPKIDKLLGGLDIYFNPHFFVAPLSRQCKKVITFHDLSFERYPNFFSWRKRLWQKFLMNTRQEAKRADKIIAVSQSTKEDLVNLYGVEPEKITVVYSGVGEQFRPMDSEQRTTDHIRKKYNLPEKFILYFGTIEPRKNLVGLIKAFELLKAKLQIAKPSQAYPNSKFKLVIAGAEGWLYQDIFKAARESKCSQDIIFTGFIEEADKPYLYNLAELFVYPSFFEGFGFPPLEAMACGLPTIVSCNSSLPEVVDQAALMIDSSNIDELAWVMEMALTDHNLRQRLIQKGIEQARKFSWQRCAEKTLKVLTK
jgi:glycosyltransferase involved in cell wall biosynthesis